MPARIRGREEDMLGGDGAEGRHQCALHLVNDVEVEARQSVAGAVCVIPAETGGRLGELGHAWRALRHVETAACLRAVLFFLPRQPFARAFALVAQQAAGDGVARPRRPNRPRTLVDKDTSDVVSRSVEPDQSLLRAIKVQRCFLEARLGEVRVRLAQSVLIPCCSRGRTDECTSRRERGYGSGSQLRGWD